jgi:hypothetical protein
MTRILSCAAMVGLLVASSSSVFAKGPGAATSASSPGQQMQTGGSTNGPGASGYAPGKQMQSGGCAGPGASGCAPPKNTGIIPQ